jgi:CHAD domain-containing protein
MLQERELKLDVPEGFTLPPLDGDELPARTFVSTYFDSDDRLLSRAGITLRRRVENGLSVWQLKLPRKDHRLELEEPGGPVPPERLMALLAGILRDRDLEPFISLQTVRQGVRVRREELDVADVVLDRVSVLENGGVASSFDELEVELVEGSDDDLDGLRKVLVGAGARRGEGRPKALRGRPAAEPAGKGKDAEVFTGLLRRQYIALCTHDPGVRLGDDPEELHDLRVAVRRLRALLRAAREALAPEAEELRQELRWLGGELGPARDLDVLIERLRAEADAELDPPDREAFEPILGRLAADRAAAGAQIGSALSSERYGALLDRLEQFVEAPPFAAKLSLEKLAAAEFRRAKKAERGLSKPPADDELHALRIRAKRARYAAELAGKPTRRVAESARKLQDVLGAHQDAVVAEQRLRELAAEAGPATALAAGRLLEGERQRRDETRAGFPKAWKRLERAGDRAFA